MNIDEFNDAFRRQGYSALGKTVDEVLSHDDPELANHVFAAICMRILDKDFDSLTDTERKLREVNILCGAIGNSGFAGYFFENYADSDSWDIVLAGLKEMGAEDLAVIFERAIAVFHGSKPSADETERWAQLELLSEESRDILSDCSMKFSDLNIGIADLGIAYAKKHKADIVLAWT